MQPQLAVDWVSSPHASKRTVQWVRSAITATAMLLSAAADFYRD